MKVGTQEQHRHLKSAVFRPEVRRREEDSDHDARREIMMISCDFEGSVWQELMLNDTYIV